MAVLTIIINYVDLRKFYKTGKYSSFNKSTIIILPEGFF